MKMKYNNKRVEFREFTDYYELLDHLEFSNPNGNDTIETISKSDLEPVGIDFDILYCYEFVKIRREIPEDNLDYTTYAAYPAQIESMFEIDPIIVINYVHGYPVKNPAWLIKKPFTSLDDSYITFNDSVTRCENLVELFELIKDNTITGDELDYDARANLWFIKDGE